MTTARIFPIASIVLAAVATILLIVVASTPSYIKSNIQNVGAFHQCMAKPIIGPGFSARSHSRPFHMLQNLPPGFPSGPISIPGNGGSIPVPGGTITVDPIPIGGGGGGDGDCNSLSTCAELCQNDGTGRGIACHKYFCFAKPTDAACVPTTSRPTVTQAPIKNPTNTQVHYGFDTGHPICDTTTSICEDCNKINAIRAFLILAILTAGATTAIGIVLLISSSVAPSMYIIGACIAGASVIAALISMSLVISLKVQMQNDRSYYWGEYTLDYGFVLHVIAAVGMCIDAILLLVTKMRATYTYNNNNKVVQMNTNGTQMTTSPLHV